MEPESEPEVVLEGTTADTAVRSQTDVTSPTRLRWVLLGLAGLAAVVFGLSQWQRGEPAPPSADQEEAAADEDADGSGTEDNNDDPDDSPGEAASNQPQGSDDSAEPGQSSNPTGEPQLVVPGSGPLLGEETGLALVIANSSSQEIRLLDLDSGTEYQLAARGRTVGVLDGHVVVQGRDSILALPLETPDEVGVQLASSTGGWLEAIGVVNGVVWAGRQVNFSPGEENELSLQAFDISGTMVSERPFDVSTAVFGPPPVGELLQESGGGIYRQVGGDFERLSTGSLVTAGEDLALIRECDDRRNCGFYWYRISNWDGPLELPTPNVEGPSEFVSLQANDRWLLEEDWSSGRFRVIDVATGLVVREQRRSDFDGALRVSEPFSPDGRWLMVNDLSGILIVDLDTGTEFLYESDFTGAGSSFEAVFMNIDDVGFVP